MEKRSIIDSYVRMVRELVKYMQLCINIPLENFPEREKLEKRILKNLLMTLDKYLMKREAKIEDFDVSLDIGLNLIAYLVIDKELRALSYQLPKEDSKKEVIIDGLRDNNRYIFSCNFDLIIENGKSFLTGKITRQNLDMTTDYIREMVGYNDSEDFWNKDLLFSEETSCIYKYLHEYYEEYYKKHINDDTDFYQELNRFIQLAISSRMNKIRFVASSIDDSHAKKYFILGVLQGIIENVCFNCIKNPVFYDKKLIETTMKESTELFETFKASESKKSTEPVAQFTDIKSRIVNGSIDYEETARYVFNRLIDRQLPTTKETTVNANAELKDEIKLYLNLFDKVKSKKEQANMSCNPQFVKIRLIKNIIINWCKKNPVGQEKMLLAFFTDNTYRMIMYAILKDEVDIEETISKIEEETKNIYEKINNRINPDDSLDDGKKPTGIK